MNEEVCRKALARAGLSVGENEQIVFIEEDSPGLGYSSLLQRYKILSLGHHVPQQYELMSTILKSNPDVDHPPDSLFDKMFDCETKMYLNILLIFKDLFQRSRTPIIWPTLYDITKDSSIVMEDLKPEFQSTLKESGSTVEEAYLAINALAQFHAASLVAKEESNIKSDSLAPYFYCRSDEINNRFFEEGLRILVKAMKLSWHQYQTDMADIIYGYSQNIGEVLKNMHIETEDKFKVINHGDFWRANLMFQYNDSNKPVNFRFVDFQLSHYGSLAWDLTYFFFTNPNTDLLYNHFDQLLSTYHKAMQEFLENCESKTRPPSLSDIHQETKRFLIYGFLKSCTDLPYQMCSSEGGIDAENLFENNEETEKLKLKLFSFKKYQQIIESHIEFLKNKNIF